MDEPLPSHTLTLTHSLSPSPPQHSVAAGCSEDTYGEFPAQSVLDTLRHPAVNMKARDAFVDLGSGMGKVREEEKKNPVSFTHRIHTHSNTHANLFSLLAPSVSLSLCLSVSLFSLTHTHAPI